MTLRQRVERLERQMLPLQQGYADLQTAINALSSEETSVAATITSLQQQIAAGSPVTGDQLEALATQVGGVTTQLTAIAPPPVPISNSGTPPPAATVKPTGA